MRGLTTEKDMNDNLELRGAQMVLDEAKSNLRRSVHPCGCEGGKKGDKVDGIALSQRICKHRDGINAALDYWEKALRHYNAISGA
jgi:hypothetical protein